MSLQHFPSRRKIAKKFDKSTKGGITLSSWCFGDIVRSQNSKFPPHFLVLDRNILDFGSASSRLSMRLVFVVAKPVGLEGSQLMCLSYIPGDVPGESVRTISSQDFKGIHKKNPKNGYSKWKEFGFAWIIQKNTEEPEITVLVDMGI